VSDSRLQHKGFTLLEVLVAMAIFAVAAIALLNAGRDQIQSSSNLENKTFAHWVAMNQVAEMQAAGTLPDVGRGDQNVSLGGRDWKVQTQIDNTPVKSVRRVTVSVAPAPANFGDETTPVDSLTAFVGEVAHATTSTTTP
jgi:general secretion pathway protein I